MVSAMKKVFAAFVAFAIVAPPLGAFGAPGEAMELMQAGMLAGTWHCETTQAGGFRSTEYDTISQIGNGTWLEGHSRPDPERGGTEPYYDFYVGFTGTRWIYIQVDPARGSFFVGQSDGTALSPSRWSVVYPTPQGHYAFTLTKNSFVIDYPDLTQSCTRAAAPEIAQSQALHLQCSTWYAGLPIDGSSPTEYLAVTRPNAALPGWWQVVGRDGPDANARVIYESTLFDLGSRRISVLINAETGAYAIANSYALKDLNDSVWMVDYPTRESGFAFKEVSYNAPAPNADIPTGFTLIFKDGYQRCATR